MVGAAVLYCCECRKANTTACLPSAATYWFAVTSSVRGRQQTVEVARLHRGANALVGAIIFVRQRGIRLGQLVEVAPMPSEPCIAARKRYVSGVVRPFMIRHVGDPGGHDLRRVGHARSPPGCAGGRRPRCCPRPDLVDALQNAEVDAAAAAGAGFDLELRDAWRAGGPGSRRRCARTAPRSCAARPAAASGQPGSEKGGSCPT